MRAGQLFQGVPLQGVRKALAALSNEWADGWEQAYVPCAGEFAACRILSSHVSPADMHTSDITLFSSVLGYALAGKDLLDLGIEIHDPDDDPTVVEFDPAELPDDEDPPDVRPGDIVWDVPWSEWVQHPVRDRERLTTRVGGSDDAEHGDAIEYAARALLTQKWFSMSRSNYFAREVAREVALERDAYAANVRSHIEDLYDDLAGLAYEVADCRVVAMDACWEDDALVFLDPPAYTGGYSSMFDTAGRVTWNEPTIDQFEPNERQILLDELEAKPADVVYLLYIQDIYEEQFDTDGWDRWFASKQTSERIDYLCANWDTGLSMVERASPSMEEGDIPIWEPGDWLNNHSEVAFVELSRGVAQYYRNLLVKNLHAGVSGELNGAFIVDGKLVGVCGINTGFATKDGGEDLYVMYAVAPTYGDELAKPLSQLINRFLKTEDFLDDVRGLTNLGVADGRVSGVKTTCFSAYPETKSYEGIWDQVACEEDPDGPSAYKLQYQADFVAKSYQQQITEYQDECDRYERLQEQEA